MSKLSLSARHHLWLLLAAILAYWPVALYQFGLKWDLIDVVFPFRYFFSESMQAGYFPFWNPYQQTGTPFFADLQAPTYYPELLLVSLLGGYRLLVMHLLLIGYFFIAAAGLYRLSFYFSSHRTAALGAALAYLLSGYLVGHGQHFFLIIGAAWLPWVLWSYLLLLRRLRPRDAVRTALFLFLMLTGAYQALSIALAYLLLLLFCAHILRRGTLRQIGPLLWSHLLLAGLTLALCSPLILATVEVLGQVERLEAGVPWSAVEAFQQPLSTLLSLLQPFSTLAANAPYGGQDITLINHYVGLLPLLAALLALRQKLARPLYLLLSFGLLMLGLSFSVLPWGLWSHRYLPLMNMFIISPYLRIFATLALCLLAGQYLARLFEQPAAEWPVFRRGLIALTLLLTGLGLASGLALEVLPKPWQGADFFLQGHFATNVFFQSLQQLVLLLLLLIALGRRPAPARLVPGVLLFIAVEMTLATQWQAPATLIDPFHKPAQMQASLHLMPRGFPLPVDGPLVHNDEQHSFPAPFWRNTYIFRKQVSFDAFSSFKLKNYAALVYDYPRLQNALMQHRLGYFSDSLSTYQQLIDAEIDPGQPYRVLHLPKGSYHELAARNAQRLGTESYRITAFNPHEVRLTTQTDRACYFTLLQSYYPGWQAQLDGRPIPMYRSNLNYRSVYIPKGKHELHFSFDKPVLRYAYWASEALCVLLLLALLYSGPFPRRLPALLSVLFAVLLLRLAFLWIPARAAPLPTGEQLARRDAAAPLLASFPPAFAQQRKEGDEQQADSLAPRQGYRVTPQDEFIPLLELANPGQNLMGSRLMLRFRYRSDSLIQALVASDVAGEWHAEKLVRFARKDSGWQEVWYQRALPKGKDTRPWKVYIWNLEGESFALKDLQLDFYSP